MTIRTLTDLVQRSDAWHDARRGMVTASIVGKLITAKTLKPADNDTSRRLTEQLVAERITGYTEPTYLSDDMIRGIEDEPRAAAKYAEHYAPVTTAGFMVRDDWGFPIGYSPDGLIGDVGLIEIKSRRQHHQLAAIVTDTVPADCMAQIQCGLLVSGRRWCDYVSYSGGMPMWVKRVHPEQRWQAAIVAAVRHFEAAAVAMLATYDRATVGLPMTERAGDLDEMRI